MRAAAGEVASPQVDATRALAIKQHGVRSDGPGSAEHDRKGMGSVSMRKHRDCFAYVLRNKPSPPSIRSVVKAKGPNRELVGR
jgi:hypothetical protein